jgi:hypothetical protein
MRQRPYSKTRTTRRGTGGGPYQPGHSAVSRSRPGSSNPLPYIVGGLTAAVILIAIALPKEGEPAPEIGYPSERKPVETVKPSTEIDTRYFEGGFPSEAEDLYREGHTLLNEAMSAEKGVDQKKLKAALKKLDAAVDGYYELEKKYPADPRIGNRINKINKLRSIARKSFSL